jgi:hypothetical protein
MRTTTNVSAVSRRLQSPRWPRQTGGARPSRAFYVSPVSPRPAASHARRGGSSRRMATPARVTHGGGRARDMAREIRLDADHQPGLQPSVLSPSASSISSSLVDQTVAVEYRSAADSVWIRSCSRRCRGWAQNRMIGARSVARRLRLTCRSESAIGVTRFRYKSSHCATGPGSGGRAGSPYCADFGSMPVTTLAVQFWAFCASTSRADGHRWLDPGADGRRSGQSR